MAAQKKRLEDHDVEAKQDDATPAAPIDGEALRQALLQAPEGGAKSYVHSMHEKAEAVFAGRDLGVGEDIERAWSLRRQFFFILFASAAMWAAVLGPIALIF